MNRYVGLYRRFNYQQPMRREVRCRPEVAKQFWRMRDRYSFFGSLDGIIIYSTGALT